METRRFIGRHAELAVLERHLQDVRERAAGKIVALRGRRQVGKSRLVDEFIRRSGASAVFYTASRQSSSEELRNFREQLARSPLRSASVAAAGPLGSWEAAIEIAAGDASAEQPVVLVMDELPFLVESEPAIEGILQKQWDRSLEHRPVLLMLIGSDISMMSALGEYGRPLYGRLTEMTIGPLSPAAVAEMLKLDAPSALDAYLTIGGFPRLAQIWRSGEDVWRFLRRELQNPESPLIVLGERSLRAEFPVELKARSALEAIGSGERTFTAIMHRALLSNKTLESTLDMLRSKRVIDKAVPYSAELRPKLSRYHVADPYMRFWLRFIRKSLPAIERGRGELVYREIRDNWTSFAGRAIEPVVREAIQRALPDARFGAAQFVGAFWNRDDSVQVDLVGGRQPATSKPIDFVGSIKWRERAKFDRGDFSALVRQRALVPGASDDSLLVGVSRNGFAVSGLDVCLSAQETLAAFQS
jgi:uncharacterized protein